jgi:hypothetical protein
MTQTTTPPATETPTRPVYADPRYDERDPCLPYVDQEPAGARWDLAFGCCLSFGPFDNGGPLRVTISMSDHEAAAGICVREVTPQQVRNYAHYLLRMVGEEVGPTRCASHRPGRYPEAVVLVDGEPRCEPCADRIAPNDPDRRSSLPGTVA